jgi:hypothetical protein
VAEEGQALALLSELERAGGISVIGLHLARPDLPYSEFESLCVMLGKMHEAVRFAIGDAIILGEKLYREQAYQAIEQIGLSEKGRMEYVRVAERVPRSIRRPDISWSHHRAVATLPPPEQKAWLAKAVDEGLSHHALREALRDGAEANHPTTCHCCGRPLDD